MIPITTTLGTFNVWTKRIGNNPALKVLLLHGGPGGTHDCFEAVDSFLPAAGIEYYYYDQLGSGRSDNPADSRMWDLNRFVDEVEQVRIALELGPDNFVLLGHSWGGLLAMEYALKHGEKLKGLVISNMMSSVPAYNRYATDILMPAMNQDDLAEILEIEDARDFANPRYMELLVRSYYVDHIVRMNPVPEPVKYSFAHLNHYLYETMQGPSELGISQEASLAAWDRTDDLQAHHHPDARPRWPPRHHGPRVSRDDVDQTAQWFLLHLRERQSHGDVRRSGGLLRSIALLAEGT
jgi:proline iminopeptidase